MCYYLSGSLPTLPEACDSDCSLTRLLFLRHQTLRRGWGLFCGGVFLLVIGPMLVQCIVHTLVRSSSSCRTASSSSWVRLPLSSSSISCSGDKWKHGLLEIWILTAWNGALWRNYLVVRVHFEFFYEFNKVKANSSYIYLQNFHGKI